MINLKEFAKEIHENAVAHGWWEKDVPPEETIALIHSEWSEALEEYRAGRPIVWHNCNVDCDVCEQCKGCYYHVNAEPEKCEYRGKPEGIAVELIDGCIRILDYLAHKDEDVELLISKSNPLLWCDGDVVSTAKIVSTLHYHTAIAHESCLGIDASRLEYAMSMAFAWIEANGLDPVTILREKHEYNKTRPYKHGGKIC